MEFYTKPLSTLNNDEMDGDDDEMDSKKMGMEDMDIEEEKELEDDNE